MGYKLEQPYTDKERTDFIFRYNQDCFQEGYKCRIEETDTAIYALEENELLDNGEIVLNPNYEQEQAEKEAERVGNLTMTALDFIGVLEHYGLNYATQIKPFLEANPELDKQLKYCQNVYCKVARSVMPITVGNITITAEMVERAFRIKNGEDV